MDSAMFAGLAQKENRIMATVTYYTDKHNGKIYRVRSNSVIVQQYAAGSVIYSDGSSKGKQSETSFKTRKTLVSWLKMMDF